MHTDDPAVLELHPVPHPNPGVARAGFGLSDPYLEACWAPVVGPSSTLLLRQCPERWKDGVPARVEAADLARSIGLGRGTGRNSPLTRTLERLERFGFLHRVSVTEVAVYTEVPPVSGRQLDHLPAWNRSRHEDLLGRHLEGLSRPTTRSQPDDPPRMEMSERLAHLRRPAGPKPPGRHL